MPPLQLAGGVSSTSTSTTFTTTRSNGGAAHDTETKSLQLLNGTTSSSSSSDVHTSQTGNNNNNNESQRELSVPGAFHQDGPGVTTTTMTTTNSIASSAEHDYYFGYRGNTSHVAPASNTTTNNNSSDNSTNGFDNNSDHATSATGNSGHHHGDHASTSHATHTVTSEAATALGADAAVAVGGGSNSSGPMIIEAHRVDDDDSNEFGTTTGSRSGTKPIVYARDVKLDNFKRRVVYGIIFAFILAVTLMIVFLVLRDVNNASDAEDQTCDFDDEICCETDFDNKDDLPIPKSIPLLCYCNQSLAFVKDDMTEKGKLMAFFVQRYAKENGLDDTPAEDSIDWFDTESINSTTFCEGNNQLYLGISTLEDYPPIANFSVIPDTIITSTLIVIELYEELEGYRWRNNDGWLESIDICGW